MYSSLPSFDTIEYKGSFKNGASRTLLLARYSLALVVNGFFIFESRTGLSLNTLGSSSALLGVQIVEESELSKPDFKNRFTYSLWIAS